MDAHTIATIAACLAILSIVATFVGTWAVLRYRVGVNERNHTMCSEKTTKLIERLFDRCDRHERENAKEHTEMAVAIGKVEATQQSVEVLADMVTDLLKANGHDTDKYRNRRTRR